MIIDGRKIAEEIIEELKKKRKPQKFLSAFLVGENPASEKFLLKKKETAEKLKIDFQFIDLGGSLGIPYKEDEKAISKSPL